jgi:hypothetical protein
VYIATTPAPHPRATLPAKPADKHPPGIVRELTLVPPPATTPPPAPAAAKPDCDPPFYFDGSKKIYKPGCL